MGSILQDCYETKRRSCRKVVFEFSSMVKTSVQEDETKNVLKADYFAAYDWTRVIGKIDLTVRSQPRLGVEPTNYLWAETKQGKRKDIYESFIQLILTIGKGRIYEQEMPPYFLGAADAEKIAFVEYNKVMHIFSKTDFNWNVTPSDHSTKEFRELYDLLHDDLANDVRIYKFAYDDKLIRSFIRSNFKEGRKDVRKQSVGKNNFTFVYFDWVKSVKDSIAVDWQAMQKAGILDCDFFLADLMSKDGMSIKDKLKVVLEKTKYKVLVKADLGGIFGDAFKEFSFKDGQKAYNQFWNRYERPPKPIYQRYILDRRDLLVPQDIREIKGSYYTPEQWVRLSQEYLAKALGEDWQEEYYVWDCAAGSGNLLRGLTNKYNIYASTLDDSDVKVMHDAIDGGRLNLVKSNVFQFDFLNDGYIEKDGVMVSDLVNCKKIPESLRNIIADSEKRKKLVIYINPPYAESSNKRTKTGSGENRENLSISEVKNLYQFNCGKALNELFAQFYVRIVEEIPSSTLAVFSKLNTLQGSNFRDFRRLYGRKLRSLFIVPANTFDNVKGDFPIGFQIYDCGSIDDFESIDAHVYGYDGQWSELKKVSSYKGKKYIIDWYRKHYDKTGCRIAYMRYVGTDFQNSGDTFIAAQPSENDVRKCLGTWITPDNLLASCVYFAVRLCIPKNWKNDRDQFLYPKENVLLDTEFVYDCLIYAIFSGQNKYMFDGKVCYWIPYYEEEVNSPSPFNSRFLSDFLNGKIKRKDPKGYTADMFEQQAAEETAKMKPLDALSDEARAVLDSGREIWRYYMTKPGIRANASFLDIRAYFQGYKVTDKGKRMMNSTSTDERYTELLADLRGKMKALEAHIEPKIYEHGFLLK